MANFAEELGTQIRRDVANNAAKIVTNNRARSAQNVVRSPTSKQKEPSLSVLDSMLKGWEAYEKAEAGKEQAYQQSPKGAYTGNSARELETKQLVASANNYPEGAKAQQSKGKGDHAYLQSKEGAKNTYTTKNKAGSSAYGKYQFMPSTAKGIAKEIGIPEEEWDTPENQEKIMAAAKKGYSKSLARWGETDTEENQYVIHQLGASRAKRYFSGKLTENDKKVMKDNLPKAEQGVTDIVAAWSKRYAAEALNYVDVFNGVQGKQVLHRGPNNEAYDFIPFSNVTRTDELEHIISLYEDQPEMHAQAVKANNSIMESISGHEANVDANLYGRFMLDVDTGKLTVEEALAKAARL